jgi:molecular chaperone DnaK (HSP70)
LIDGTLWADRDAGQHFLRSLIATLPHHDEIDQLVMTVPVAAFRGYVDWLNSIVGEAAEKIRVVDESTAAALGYAVTEPGSLVLVFDFGGGTLDLSLVQLPDSRERTGGILSLFRHTPTAKHAARVMAKAGRVIGGSDVDHWLLLEVLKQTHLTLPNSVTTTPRCSRTASRPRSICPRARPRRSCLRRKDARIPSSSRAANSSRCWKRTVSTPPSATRSTR